ncbi:MAG: S-adenosylmethionine:tRNA ribosyltransferase-isomerase [Chitinophagales bacterium]|nr:S-adenosylmethionine:tRNA ribosyltransferase-isomerase [Chitinophagaceae bacterium]MCB9063989.1 S-adenosylmethionine:tRNA ribosyltransferase-isomerase [Chitinophagales bacterium]
MHPSELSIEDFTYELPDERIAKYPLEHRDASKLLVYKKGALAEDTYRNIAGRIPNNALMLFNQTKVVQARLLFKKDTGGMIEVFCLEPHEQYSDIQTAMLQHGKVWWKCIIGGASKWKHGMVLQQIHEGLTLSASIVERDMGSFTLELSWDNDLSFAEVLSIAGKVPLPPYLHREVEESDKERYQTIYAKEKGSVAAPTAGLHFTDAVMQKLDDKCIEQEFITLHVGAGTFMPVKSDTMQGHDMHAEWIDVEVDTINKLIQAKEEGRKVVAVGTTTMRTLESLYWIGAKLLEHRTPDLSGYAVTQWEPYELSGTHNAKDALKALVDWLLLNKQHKLLTRTQILIAPGYTTRIIDGLVTNFHQPQSTLLLLVAAMIGDDWRKVYDHAMQNDFRFLSYGDGCLLWQ